MSILAMNQNVFSSIFVGKKVSKEAKRAIEAEMIVPASATRMSYDEMEYVDGGAFLGVGANASISISFYNFVVGRMNAMSTNAKATALMSMAISNSFPQALSAVFGLLASIGSAFISVCLANPVLLVVGGILAVAGITLMAGMIVAGARNKGSRIGLEIGLFTVKDICELV